MEIYSKSSCIVPLEDYAKICKVDSLWGFEDHICMNWECAALTSVMICDSTQPRDLVRAIQRPGA